MRAFNPGSRGAEENIVTIDTDSAPRIMFYGEDFLCEDLPVGTRVIYPNRPMQGLPNPRAAIRQALKGPELERSTRYTGVSDANASFVLGKLLAPQLNNLTLGRSSEFSWSLLANNNVVYVGAERVISAELQNFPVKFAYSYDYMGILNSQPAPGEPELFADPPSVNARDASEDGESFALVSRFPGPAGQSEIATFTSNTAPARLAAVQWFATSTGASDLVKRLRLPLGRFAAVLPGHPADQVQGGRSSGDVLLQAPGTRCHRSRKRQVEDSRCAPYSSRRQVSFSARYAPGPKPPPVGK